MNNTLARVVNRISTRTEEIDGRRAAAAMGCRNGQAAIPGWSSPMQYVFFESALMEMPDPCNVLVCGVYHGLDLVLFERANEYACRQLNLYGVDLFEAGPCADWSDEERAKGTWEANLFGPPPNIDAARRNAPTATIVIANSIEFMRKTDLRFDLVYLDTSHDYRTVFSEISVARRVMKPGALLSGDDYARLRPDWGVDRAVSELLPGHVCLWNRIWIST